MPMYREIKEQQRLPRVGQSVKSKKFGTVWKVIEEKEVWIDAGRCPGIETEGSHLIPAVYLRFWKPESGQSPGQGKTMEHLYTLCGDSFQEHWDILSALKI